MKRIMWGITVSVLAAGSANAALLSRAGGQAYYDDVLQITWLADANLAASNTFGVTGINLDGTMTKTKASQWIEAMNSANYLGVNNWRLPWTVDPGSGCRFGIGGSYSGAACGWNVDLSTGEMAHLFYSTLGNVGYYDTSGSPTGCPGYPNYCLTNTGPFSNLQPDIYWSGESYHPIGYAPYSWLFYFDYGSQDFGNEGYRHYAWAVRDGDIGDIGAVPAPGALWLFGTGVAALGAALKRRTRGSGTTA